ncbi:hypothetical protein KBI52_04535 [Microvirga sp. HBU67558]|uniref:hypothetical protein n=1 Tax=Microvirga TaxID=186650 RepID=UPI001B37ECF9|nr:MULTISPECIES: hypothetical protein [unclassified Microvirga]MBQ0819490.1 hypothetical protein [Microvirga sp. HBU67558]
MMTPELYFNSTYDARGFLQAHPYAFYVCTAADGMEDQPDAVHALYSAIQDNRFLGDAFVVYVDHNEREQWVHFVSDQSADIGVAQAVISPAEPGRAEHQPVLQPAPVTVETMQDDTWELIPPRRPDDVHVQRERQMLEAMAAYEPFPGEHVTVPDFDVLSIDSSDEVGLHGRVGAWCRSNLEHPYTLHKATFKKSVLSGRRHGRSPTRWYWTLIFGSAEDREKFVQRWGRMTWPCDFTVYKW